VASASQPPYDPVVELIIRRAAWNGRGCNIQQANFIWQVTYLSAANPNVSLSNRRTIAQVPLRAGKSKVIMLSTDICLERGANVMITGHSNKSVDVNVLRLVRNLLADDKSTEGIHHFLPDTFEAIYSQPEIVSRENDYHPGDKESDVAFRSTPNNQSLLPTFYRS